MKNHKALLAAVFATLLFAVPAHAQLFGGGGGPKQVVLKDDSDPKQVFQQMIDDGNALRHITKAYNGPSTKVAIGTVKLNFVTDDSDTATTKEFMGKASVSVSSNMTLTGVSPETMQAIADSFHASLRNKLTSLGYEVVPQDQLLALPDYKKAVADTKSPDVSFRGAVTTVYAAGTGNIKTFSMRNFSYEQKMPVVQADLTLTFAAFDKEGRRGAYEISAGIASRVQSTVAGSMSVMMENGGNYSFDVVQPLVLPGKIEDRVEARAASTAQTAGSVALGLLGAVLGSKQSSKTSYYDVVAAKDYQAVMAADMDRVAAVVANVMTKRQ